MDDVQETMYVNLVFVQNEVPSQALATSNEMNYQSMVIPVSKIKLKQTFTFDHPTNE